MTKEIYIYNLLQWRVNYVNSQVHTQYPLKIINENHNYERNYILLVLIINSREYYTPCTTALTQLLFATDQSNSSHCKLGSY